MEETGNKDHTIQVKNRFATYVEYLAVVDSLLPSVQLKRIENDSADKDYTYFVVMPDEEIKFNVMEIQNYVDSICDELEAEKLKILDNVVNSGYASITGEDSSYDSDGSEEQTPNHDDVSRTVSDTLGQEFSEYVSTSQQKQALQWQQSDIAYQSRLEFALKLGYTEKLVQSALLKLGPNPEQNELLEELIKLGAHQQSCAKLKNASDGCGNVDEFIKQISTVTSSDRNKLRPIVVDGSNVAMSHGNKEVFSCRGIRICVDWFRSRGHTEITVFVPKWRKETPRPDNHITDQDILHELERERLLVFTPSREVGGKRMVCYDDRYVLKLAAENDGIVVSNDNYRDLIQECPEFRKVVEERVLMYSFVNDRFMPPDDPLGRSGPTLDNFLKMPTFCKGGETCPYGKKCTYGNKCKYNHPERGHGPQKSVTERLVENAQKQLLARNVDPTAKKVRGKSLSLPLQSSSNNDGQLPMNCQQGFDVHKQPLSRTKSTTVSSNKPETLDLSKSATQADGSRNYGHLSATSPQSPSTSYCCMMYQMNHVSQVSQSGDAPSTFTITPRSTERDATEVNLHRKLQRQLSINPTCDPRIYHTQRRFTSPKTTHHMPAAKHYSYQEQNYLTPSHSNVTRISSAPSAKSPYTVTDECAHESSSDSQLNLSCKPADLSPVSSSLWSVHSHGSTTAGGNYVVIPQNVEETRRKLHYHLASIFPEEQVDAAMKYYPNETNPQKICAAILSMFSTKQ